MSNIAVEALQNALGQLQQAAAPAAKVAETHRAAIAALQAQITPLQQQVDSHKAALTQLEAMNSSNAASQQQLESAIAILQKG